MSRACENHRAVVFGGPAAVRSGAFLLGGDALNLWWRGSWWRVTPPAVPFASACCPESVKQ